MHYYISITVDIDPDETTITGDRNKLEWNGLRYLRELRDATSLPGSVVTWFVRADDQIAQLCGSYDYLFQKNQSFWDFVRKEGDEIALHPHLYVFDASKKCYCSLRDSTACSEQLNRIHASLTKAGYSFQSIRIGEAFHSTELMTCIDNLGYAVDSTAVPGRFRDDAQRCFDWSSTSNAPYHPDSMDFRVPGQRSLGVLEVPMTTAKFKAEYDSGPKLRYMSLSYRSDIFARGFEEYLANCGEGEARSVVFIVHPGEVFGTEKAASHGGLYSFDLHSVRVNLGAALESIESSGGSYSFVRICDFTSDSFQGLRWA
jgi:hypothetical protein